MAHPMTMFEKIWNDHSILEDQDGRTLLFVSRHFAHDGSCHAFSFLEQRGLPLRRPDQTFATPDHGIPTRSHRLEEIADPEQHFAVTALKRNSEMHGFTLFDLGDPRQGITHVVGPEQGLTQPGMVIACGDSHTATHGAFGSLAFGIGASEVCHVLATQTFWQKRPGTMRVLVDGELSVGVTAKDVVLAVIARVGANGASGLVIEYAGATIRRMSMEERLTVCNMSIEAGARAGLIAPDDVTFAYLSARPYAPSGDEWEAAVSYWRTLPSDDGATFDVQLQINASDIAPMVTWGNSPADAIPVTACVPDPAHASSEQESEAIRQALQYMGLSAGTLMTDISVDQVFIGSCTNGRIEDLREAAAIARLGRASVPSIVSPGSGLVKQQAETEGLDRVFREAGFEWREAGCSMCVAMNGDLVPAGMRCASTSNRNFRGRQGPGSRTHLMSPAMAAAAALHGRIVDVRQIDRS